MIHISKRCCCEAPLFTVFQNSHISASDRWYKLTALQKENFLKQCQTHRCGLKRCPESMRAYTQLPTVSHPKSSIKTVKTTVWELRELMKTTNPFLLRLATLVRLMNKYSKLLKFFLQQYIANSSKPKFGRSKS